MNWIRMYENVIFEINCLLHGADLLKNPLGMSFTNREEGYYKLFRRAIERVANVLSLTSSSHRLPSPNRVYASRCERCLLFLPISTASRSLLRRFDSEPALANRSASLSPPSNHFSHRFLRAAKANERGTDDFQSKRRVCEAGSPKWSCSRSLSARSAHWRLRSSCR